MKKIPFSLLALVLIFSACDRVEEQRDNIDSSEVNALAENEFATILALVETEGEPDGRIAQVSELPNCATTTYEAGTRTLTIDFGSENCLCLDGLYRRGKIIAVFTGTPRRVGNSAQLSLENYYVNDFRFQGNKTYTLLSESTENLKWQVEVNNASIETPDGNFTWRASRTIERIEGNDTPLLGRDDVYLIEGSSEGVNRRGRAFTATIITPLKKVREIGCARVFVSGVVELSNEDGQSMILNYDPNNDEACDRLAEVTINGRSRIISLR